MKNLKDIEKFLTDAKPPDQTVSSTKHNTWQRIIAHKKIRGKRGLSIIKPWIWTLASIILILICILLMLWLKKV